MTTFIKPSQTLYVRQLDNKLSKIGLPTSHCIQSLIKLAALTLSQSSASSKTELKTSLYHLFSQHAAVIDVVVKKTENMRGQAFVVLRDVAGATAAMRALQGFPFFARALKIEYARSKSNAVSLLEGRVAPPQRKSPVVAKQDEITKQDVIENGTDNQQNVGGAQKRIRGLAEGDDENEGDGGDKKRKAPTAANDADDNDEDDVDMEEEDDDDEDGNPPSKILFLHSLPSQITSGGPDILTTLFKDYLGFKEVRLVPGKSELAFVEFKTVEQAADAKVRLDGFSIVQGKSLKIQFAKV
ncbi:hypothetical protein HDU83_009286 [Entophlyctis luteolus]|nr:hypothetical protein HDU82_002021 [Entophlyctis luteolus]KAJ3350969.1 hypothetical protein HDU83_009286 [Entophlyctis luteolus]